MDKGKETMEKINEVIMKMCEIAGIRFEEIDLTDSDWNKGGDWVEEERDEFVLWLTEWLKDKNNFNLFVGTWESRCFASRKKIASEFARDYGWELL